MSARRTREAVEKNTNRRGVIGIHSRDAGQAARESWNTIKRGDGIRCVFACVCPPPLYRPSTPPHTPTPGHKTAEGEGFGGALRESPLRCPAPQAPLQGRFPANPHIRTFSLSATSLIRGSLFFFPSESAPPPPPPNPSPLRRPREKKKKCQGPLTPSESYHIHQGDQRSDLSLFLSDARLHRAARDAAAAMVI